MRRRESKDLRARIEDKDQTNEGGTEELDRTEALEALAFLLFQVALARRRVQTIMTADDFAMALWARELSFVYTVLSDVDSLLRRLRRATG